MGQPEKTDLLIENGYIVTMDPGRRIIPDGSIAVEGDTIIDIGTREDLRGKYLPLETIDARNRFVFPGFITTHTHLFQVLLKGLGRDKTLFDWLDSSVRKAMRNYDEEAMYYAALTGLIEALRTGTTTVTDFQYCHSRRGLDEPVLQAFEDIGIRGVLSKSHTDVSGFPPDAVCDYVETEDDFFADTETLCRKYQGHSRISMSIAPGIIWDLTREGYLNTRKLADTYGIPVTMHLVETEDDDDYALKTYGMRTIPFLDECGILGPDFVSVHSVHVTDDDIELFRKRGVTVCHCPVSNMILASGTAPVHKFLKAGIPVSLACDGAASNDTQDMLEVLKFTALKHKLATRNAAVVSASEVLEMATLGGARALLMDKHIGSLEVGKKADLFIFNPLNARSVPVHDPVSTLVYSAAQPNIETVITGGKKVLDNGRITCLNEDEVLGRTQKIASKLLAKSGLGNSQWGKRVKVDLFEGS